MKNEALSSGAEEAPISLTGGMDAGRGVVSMRTCWLNLWGGGVLVRIWGGGEGGGLWLAGGHCEDVGGGDGRWSGRVWSGGFEVR
jgi:hypothetical protein